MDEPPLDCFQGRGTNSCTLKQEVNGKVNVWVFYFSFYATIMYGGFYVCSKHCVGN